MLSLTKALFNSIRKPSNLLQRDFLELELLQHSKNTSNFVKRSIDRTKDILSEELEKYQFPVYSLDENFVIDDTADSIILIEPLEGIHNFRKAFPFFASVLLYFKKINHKLELQLLLISFPALQENYYVEKGTGMWGEKFSINNSKNFRLRSSQCEDLEDSLILSNNLNDFKNLPVTLRNFGSFYYHMVSFAAGKADILYLSNLSKIHKLIFDMIVTEVGSRQENINQQRFIAGKVTLINAFKQTYL